MITLLQSELKRGARPIFIYIYTFHLITILWVVVLVLVLSCNVPRLGHLVTATSLQDLQDLI